jgi:hypothetical protein
VILQALALTARDIGLALIPTLAFGAVVYGIGKLEERAERRHLAAVERERERCRADLRRHQERRSEMRSYNARPTAGERWETAR